MLVTELIGGAIGCTMLALGLASVMAWTLRRPRGDRVLLWFGAWCGLYGARLVAEQAAFLVPMGGSARGWEYFRAFATYAINVPIALFIEALIGAGWWQSTRRVWQVLAVAAIGEVIVDLVVGRPRAAMPLNSPLVLISIVAGAANVWIARHRLGPQFKLSAIGAGGLIALLAVFNENIGRPIFPSINLEPIGVFIFVACLAYSVVGTVFRATVVVTHIHLDHAGGVGDIAGFFPEAEVVVHEKGARHLADPSRLMASARMVWGDRLDSLFGELAPTDASRIRALGDTGAVDLGNGRTLSSHYSPGHAKHHVGLIDSGTGDLYVGDAAGVYLPQTGDLRPATPPPDFDLRTALDSIALFEALGPQRLL